MPWEKSYQETDVVDRAARAFWAKGYEATSMANLVEATGINRASMYTAFDGKRGLFLRALEHYDKTYRAGFLSKLRAGHAPKDAIVAAFTTAASPEQGLPGGCLLVNTALELSPHDPEIAAFVDARLRKVEQFFHDQIAAVQSDGTSCAKLNAREAAQVLLGLFIGLRVLTRATPYDDAVNAIIAQVRSMLE